MMKLTVLVFVVLASILTVEAVIFTNNKLNCGGVKMRPLKELNSVAYPENPCNRVSKEKKKPKLDQIEKTSIVQECLCNLVGREVIWESMVNVDVSSVYQKIESIVESKLPARGAPQDEMYFFQRFQTLHRANNGFFLKEFTKTQKSEAEANELLSATCKHLNQAFAPFWYYLQSSGDVMANSQLDFTLTSHDSNLFKLVVVYESCYIMGKNA